MRRPRLGMVLMVGLAILASRTANAANPGPSKEDVFWGDWRIELDGDGRGLDMTLHRSWHRDGSQGSWTSTFDLGREELDGITPEQWKARDVPVAFDMKREAGSFHFQGHLRLGRGSGEFSFEPDPGFRAELERAGYDDVDTEGMARLAMHRVSRAWARDLARSRHHLGSLDELIRLTAHDVSPDFVAGFDALGYEALSADELVRLKAHGVTPEYARGLGSLSGSRPTADELVRLKAHGVEADNVRDFRETTPRLQVDEIIRLHAHGVTPAYARALKGVGYDLEADQLIRLKVHGITADDARKARQRHGSIEADELIRLKAHGAI